MALGLTTPGDRALSVIMVTVMTRKQRFEHTMRECYLAFWHPVSVSYESQGQPQWREAARAITGIDGKEGVSRDTLYRARKWAVARGLPCRAGRRTKLDAVTALALCEECFGPNMDSGRTVKAICEDYGVSKDRAYRTYRPRYADGSLAKEAAEQAAKAKRSA